MILLALVVCSVGGPRVSSARTASDARVRRLLRLLRDSDARVRIQALVVLGRLGDRRAVSPILAVLGDSNPSVRAMAAAALGSIGDPRARGPLAKRARDSNKLVRAQAKAALGKIAAAARSAKNARILVKLGSMSARPAPRMRRTLRQLWQRHMARARHGVALIRPGQHAHRNQKVFGVSASITRCGHHRKGSSIEATCKVSVVVDRGGSIVMMTSAGATVQLSSSGNARKIAREGQMTALDSAVASARDNLVAYLKRQ